MKRRHPDWLKVKLPSVETYAEIKSLITEANTHTVCEEANCPNLGECWSHKIATIMILGEKCTRACKYCMVKTGKPMATDLEEPKKAAKLVQQLGLQYVVITSVTRDDLQDGGSQLFGETIRQVHALTNCEVEVLTPDYINNNLRNVIQAKPDVYGHNIETVERLFHPIKPIGNYQKSLNVLKQAKEINPKQITKSGLMIGLGETLDEIHQTMRDIHDQGVIFLTIGQYLQPSPKHAPVKKYYTPDEFDSLREFGKSLGFSHIESGPLVRSSYRADKLHKYIK